MSCELLAGPYPISVGGAMVELAAPMGYSDAVGLWAQARDRVSGALLGTCVFDWDGVGRIRNAGPYAGSWDFSYDLSTGEVHWTSYFPLSGYYYGTGWDPLLLRPRNPEEAHVTWDARGMGALDRNYYLVPTFYFGRLRIYRRDRPSGSNPLLVFERALSNTPRTAWMMPADEPGTFWVLIADSAGRIEALRLRYDGLTMESVRWLNPRAEGMAGAAERCWYSQQYQVFLLLARGPSGQMLSVWSTEPAATELSSPRLDVAPRAGVAARVTVVVRGYDGEGIAGRAVAWAVTGPAQMLNAETQTDAAGSAQNWLLPQLSSAAQAVTITAEVVV